MFRKVAISCFSSILAMQAAQIPLFSDGFQNECVQEQNRRIKEPLFPITVEFRMNQRVSTVSDCWTISILNHLIATRLSLLDDEPAFTFSNSFAVFQTEVSYPRLIAILPEIVGQIDQLEEFPFTEEELDVSKQEAFAFLAELKSDLVALQNHTEASLVFFEESMQCLEIIDIVKINEGMRMLQPYHDYHLAYAEPTEIHAQSIGRESEYQNGIYGEGDNDVSEFYILDRSISEESIRFVADGTQDPFYSLPIAQWEIDTVRKIINTMGEKSLVSLLLKKKELKKLGKKIQHVHPLRFLEAVFSSSKSAHNMREVKKSSFKWDAFMEGLSDKSNDESRNNNMIPYLHGFCESVHADYNTVLSYVERRDWKHLVEYLMHK